MQSSVDFKNKVPQPETTVYSNQLRRDSEDVCNPSISGALQTECDSSLKSRVTSFTLDQSMNSLEVLSAFLCCEASFSQC